MPLTNIVESEASVKQPEKMTVAELKAWLVEKGAPTKGKSKICWTGKFYIIVVVVLLINMYF